jgi:hypothetical protein
MEIRNCIADLLSAHDCVVIPGFGGFIGNYIPSKIDPVNHTFQPPSKQLLFNVNLRHNDGLLASWIARASGCTYPEACLIIEEFVYQCTESLNSGESVHFSKVGRLYAGEEGIILFEQHKTANLLPESFGLTSFISPPVSRSSSFRPRGKNIRINPSVNLRRYFPSLLRRAAILALPLGIAALIGIVKYDTLKVQLTSKSGIISSVLSRFTSTSMVDKKTLQTNESNILPIKEVVQELIPDSATSTVQMRRPEEIARQQETAPSVDAEPAPFAIIVGAFRLEENAEKLVSELQTKGLNSVVYDRSKTGLYRVALATFRQKEEAVRLLHK